MTNLTKIAGTLSIAGTITLGALITFNGTPALQNAQNTIMDYYSRIQGYESNESRLASKIQEMKQEIVDLEAQLAAAPTQEEKAVLEAQITDLQNKLTAAETAGETLATRIVELEAEVNKANTEAAALQATVDANQTDVQPMTEEELTALGIETATIPEEPTEPTAPTNPTYKYGDTAYTVMPGVILSSETGSNNYKITNNSGKDLFVTDIPGGYEQCIYSGNYKLYGTTVQQFTFKQLSTGTAITVQVSR